MWRKITKNFLMNENLKVDIPASLQALSDIVSNVRVTNQRDSNRIKLAKEHIRGIRRHMRQLNEKVNSLESELSLLKEEK
tara:strand:+ start:1770 stop:2009 length:240 start_codon:yes stop_codon:yes gene_type:complete